MLCENNRPLEFIEVLFSELQPNIINKMQNIRDKIIASFFVEYSSFIISKSTYPKKSIPIIPTITANIIFSPPIAFYILYESVKRNDNLILFY